MDGYPNRPNDQQDGSNEAPPNRIPGIWLAVFSLAMVALATVHFAVPLLFGVPFLSCLAGQGRREDRMVAAIAGWLIGLAGIIAFISVCTVAWFAAGLGVHEEGPIDSTLEALIFSGSVGAACIVVILLQLTGSDENLL